MMLPPVFSMVRLTTFWLIRKGARRLSSRVLSQAAMSRSLKGAKATLVAALLTRMSIWPYFSSVWSIIASTASSRPAWAVIGVTSPPSARIAAAVSSNSSGLRAVITTLAPRRARSSAGGRGMPRTPPVINATLSVSWKMSLRSVWIDFSWLNAFPPVWLGLRLPMVVGADVEGYSSSDGYSEWDGPSATDDLHHQMVRRLLSHQAIPGQARNRLRPDRHRRGRRGPPAR